MNKQVKEVLRRYFYGKAHDMLEQHVNNKPINMQENKNQGASRGADDDLKQTGPGNDSLEVLLERVARVCHQANKAYCESIGDTSQVEWDQLDEEIRQSAIFGVRFAFDNPMAQPSAQHEQWVAFKASQGWKYGPVKDAELKQHPAMVPYIELPAFQRVKDRLFKAICNAMLPLNPARAFTDGEYVVDVAFNPGNNRGIEEIKMAAARFINTVNHYAQKHPEAQRSRALAATHAEQASMNGVKSVVKPVREPAKA